MEISLEWLKLKTCVYVLLIITTGLMLLGRFCCYDRPTAGVVSESNEMMVVFKSNFSYDYLVYQRGFQARVVAGKSTSRPYILFIHPCSRVA